MSFRAALQFFKTWFLPQTFDDEEILEQSALPPEAPAPSDAIASFAEPAAETPAAAPELKESASQASYAIPPVPAAMQPRDDDPPAPAADDDSSTVNPADDPASFSHLVKPPTAADQRYSRRRMEGADPSAFE